MKWLIRKLTSIFNQAESLCRLPKIESDADLLVAGYVDPVGEKNIGGPYPGVAGRKQAVILYADIANYAHLIELSEAGTQRRLEEAIRIMMSQVVDNNGRIAHLSGDAVLAEFKDADSALHCAINVQLSARQWNANSNIGGLILFRIGVSFGDVFFGHGYIYSNASNLAVRLEKLACSGGICVSGSVLQHLEGHPSIRFVTMGKKYVKNINEPVRAFWIELDSQQVGDPGTSRAAKVSVVTP